MNNKDLLYKKLNALRLEVHSSIVDDIVTTVDDLFGQPNGSKPLVSGSLLCSLCNGTGKQIPYHDVAKYYKDDGNDH